MFKFSLFNSVIAGCLALALFSSTANAENKSYSLDKSHTTVAFLIAHIGFAKTLGFFTDVSGSFDYDTESSTVSNVSIKVATKSVNTFNKARDKHVRNKDFLAVKAHPEMTFTASAAQVISDNQGQLVGELTLLGQTHPLTLDVTLNKSAKYPFGHKRFTLGVSGKGKMKRSLYGMDYGVANGLVGDDIELIVEIEAIQDK